MKPHSLKEMRHRIQLFMPQSNKDQGGGGADHWAELGTCWAGLTPIGHHALNIGHTLEHTITHKITIRYDVGIKTGFSVMHEGRFFVIEWIIDPEERKEFLVLLCTEKLSR